MLTAQSRITIPRRQPKTLRRIRLLDILHNNIHRKVNFVCAPAGYGKTTLLVDFAEDVEAVIFWYRITPEDRSLRVFVENVVYAFRQKYPEFGEQILESVQAEDVSTGAVAYALANEIENRLEDFSLLVLDDYHEISLESEIVDLIEAFLQILPDRLRLLIGSRNVYGIPTALLYVQEHLNIIGEDDLKFQPDEIMDLCRKYYKIQLTEEQSSQIARQAEGWIVAILLSLRSNNLAMDIPKIVGAREHVYTYLADDVIQSLPPELLEFMQATSLVEEFNIPMANHILGIDNAAEIIKKLDDLNLFLSRTDSEQDTNYRYHQLFSDFLRQHFAESGKKDITKMHLNIAAWFEEKGQLVKAIQHNFSAGQDKAAARLIDQVSRQLYLSGQAHTLKSWYNQLSDDQELLSETPGLLLNLAKHKISKAEYDKVDEMMDIAEKALEKRADYSNIANLMVSRGMLLRFRGQQEKARQIAEEVQNYVDEHDLDRYYWHQAERLKGITTYFLGDAAAALVHLQNAADHFQETLDKDFNPRQAHELVMTLADIGFIALAEGDIFEAQKSYKKALDLARRNRGNAHDLTNASNNYAYLLYLLGNYQEAWSYYLQAQETAEINNLSRHIGYILNGQADLLRDLEEWNQAVELYQKAQTAAESTNETGVFLDAFSGLVEVETQIGEYNQAIFYLREKASLLEQKTEELPYLLSMAKIYFKMGQNDLAQKNILQALEILPSDASATQDKAELHFFAALILNTCGQTEKAKNHLQKSLEITALLGYDQFLVNDFRQNKKEVKILLADIPEFPQVQSILKRSSKRPPLLKELVTPEAPAEEEQITLNVTAFDHSTVRLNGEIVPVSAWGSVGARALFYFILDRKHTTKDEIALEFWPEFSQAKVNSNFHATMWRVRNALSSRQILTFENDFYQINPSANLYFDLDEFESLRAGLRNMQTPLERRTAMRRIIEIYQNDYLEDIDMPWADERRRELQNVFFKVLVDLAGEEFEKKNYESALEHYYYASRIEYYQDDLHLKIMESLAALGNPHQAIKHYQEYAKKLKNELSVDPAPDLKELLDQLSA